MPHFQFVGDANGKGPDEIYAFGYLFELDGPSVDVDDGFAAMKLAGNSHFRSGQMIDAEAVEVGESDPREELWQLAELHRIDVDKRLGLPKLREILIENGALETDGD